MQLGLQVCACVRVVCNRVGAVAISPRGRIMGPGPSTGRCAMPRFLSRWTPLLLEIEPLAAGIAGALLLFVIWLFAG